MVINCCINVIVALWDQSSSNSKIVFFDEHQSLQRMKKATRSATPFPTCTSAFFFMGNEHRKSLSRKSIYIIYFLYYFGWMRFLSKIISLTLYWMGF